MVIIILNLYDGFHLGLFTINQVKDIFEAN